MPQDNPQLQNRVLVIACSDSPVMNAVVEVLSTWKLQCAEDNEEALALVEKTAFDLVITDQSSSAQEDVELLRKVRLVRPHTRVIIAADRSTPAMRLPRSAQELSVIVFTSNRNEKWGVYRQPLSGGPAQPVLVEKTQEFGFARPSPDGGWLLIERATPGTSGLSHDDLLRVPMTGGPEELIARDVSGESCAAPPLPLCAYAKQDKNELIFTSFDSELKQRRELGHFTMDHNSTGDYQWILSPDGANIAILEGGANIYLFNFQTKTLQRIIVKDWEYFDGVDWRLTERDSLSAVFGTV